MGYKFQFITLAGFHTQNIAIFELAEKYKKEGMTAYSRIQQQETVRWTLTLSNSCPFWQGVAPPNGPVAADFFYIPSDVPAVDEFLAR